MSILTYGIDFEFWFLSLILTVDFAFQGSIPLNVLSAQKHTLVSLNVDLNLT